VCGDLTALGDTREYAVAHSFLLSRFHLRRGRTRAKVGLAVPDAHLASVPGNHDHWDGDKWTRAFNPAIVPRHFEAGPWRKVWRSSGGALRLELFGIDSNAGLRQQARNILARGSFEDRDLRQLEVLLGAAGPSPGVQSVRAIVTHHSLSYQSSFPFAGPLRKEEMESASREELLRLAGQGQVAAILTGHVHEFAFQPFTRKRASGTDWVVRELRSASALQGPARRNDPLPGLLAHRIWLGPQGVTWSVYRYMWNGTFFSGQKDPSQPIEPYPEFQPGVP
jgi:muconolactone delta-isomerase